MFASSCSQMSGIHVYVGKVRITRSLKLVHDIGAESMRCFCFQLDVVVDLKSKLPLTFTQIPDKQAQPDFL